MRRFFTSLLAVFLTVSLCSGVSAASLTKKTIDGNAGAVLEMNSGISTRRWASPVKSHVFDLDSNTFCILDASASNVRIDTYKKSDCSLIKTKSIAFELPVFGGFYEGSQYNFLVFGQNNPGKDDSVTTVRTVKYSKDWERLGSVDYAANNTAYPFDAGSLRMAEYNGYLYVHTCHEMYSGHQANMTYSVDIDTMQMADDACEVTYLSFAYTSHSFNQFIQIEDGILTTVDHGDAYPRSVVLNQSLSNLQDGRFVPHNDSEYWAGTYGAQTLDLLTIPGSIGANCTGVTVGGFEVSAENYIVAVNSIDHSKVESFDSFNMHGLERDERNIILLVTDRNISENSVVNKVTLTDYIDHGKLGSTPYLVKINDDRFLVLWEEFQYSSYGSCTSNGLRYVTVDGNGNKVSEILSDTGARLSADCQPVLIGNSVMWYINKNASSRILYSLTLPEEAAETCWGDVSGNGIFDAYDLQILTEYFAGYNTTVPVPENGDADQNNSLDRRDLMILHRYWAKWDGYTLPYTK